MLESIVALSIGIGVFAATIGAVNSGSRLTKKAFTSIDISSTKKNLYASIDCGKTFQGLSAITKSTWTPSSRNPMLPLLSVISEADGVC